ncbi:MAG: hypothetical protein HDS11_02640 [Bacteroides sp.]|nr:hypothetical protein [Bacteroides sp.]
MKELEKIIRDIIDKYDFDYGNSEIILDQRQFTIEAPNNWILTVDIPKTDWEYYINPNVGSKEKSRNLLLEIATHCLVCDPEEEFIEVWSPKFEYSPFTFMDMLREDKKFFTKKAEELQYDYCF